VPINLLKKYWFCVMSDANVYILKESCAVIKVDRLRNKDIDIFGTFLKL
jgi:hypothetical protein